MHAARAKVRKRVKRVKCGLVQARLRHGSATTTPNTYSHLWPDKDESTKAIVDSVIGTG